MKETVSIRVDSELLKKVRKEAHDDFRSVNNFIELLLVKYFEQKEVKSP
jgi:hypothetical protein